MHIIIKSIKNLKNKLIISSIGIAAIVLSSNVLAQNTKINSSSDKNYVQNILANFNNISGKFKQIQINSNNKLNTKNKVINGKFAVLQPNKFLWEYEQPFKQIIQSDGKKIYVYDKDLQQVTVKNAQQAINDSPMGVLFNSSKLESNFSFSLVQATNFTNDDSWLKSIIGNINSPTWVKLKPKNNNTLYKNLAFSVGGKQMPHILAFEDTLGNKGYIELIDINKNKFKEIDFKFIIPAGVDVIQ